MEKIKRQRDKQLYKDVQLKTIATRSIIKKEANQIDKNIELALEDGPKEIVKMDQFQEEMVKKARDQKFKDDQLNRELAERKKIAFDFHRSQEIQHFTQN